MSSLFYILILATFSAAIADQELEAFAQKILESLQTQFASTQKGANSPLLQLTNGEHISLNLLTGVMNSTENIRVNVTFSGTVQVSAEFNTKRVAVSTQYGGGAALSVRESENEETQFKTPKEVDVEEVNNFLNPLYEKNVEDHENLDDGETGVILLHGAETKIGVKANQRRAEAKVRGGYIVGVKSKVTKNFQ